MALDTQVNDNTKMWYQEVYEINYQEQWSTEFCWWFQTTLFEYEKAGFPHGKHLMGYTKWRKENGIEFDNPDTGK